MRRLFTALTLLLLAQVFQPAWAADCSITQDPGVPVTATTETLYDVCYPHLQIKFNPATGTARWSAEVQYPALSNNTYARTNNFHREPQLPEAIAPTAGDYSGHSFRIEDSQGNALPGLRLARGHLAPADDFSGDLPAMKNSFSMANMVPQVQDCNNSGVWALIEEYTRDVARKYGKVYILTGPYYDGNTTATRDGVTYHYDTLGGGVKAPTHMWKMVANPQTRTVIAFRVPNVKVCNTRPSDWLVPRGELEQQIGLKAFPKFNTYTNITKLERTN